MIRGDQPAEMRAVRVRQRLLVGSALVALTAVAAFVSLPADAKDTKVTTPTVKTTSTSTAKTTTTSTTTSSTTTTSKATTTATSSTSTTAKKTDPNDADGDGIPDSKQKPKTADDANGDGIPDSKQKPKTADDADGDGVPDSKQTGAKAKPATQAVEPPSTIAEMWKRMMAPAKPHAAPPPLTHQAAVVPAFKDIVRGPDGKVLPAAKPKQPAVAAAAAATAATGAAAAAAASKAPAPTQATKVAEQKRPLPPPPPPAPGTYRANEILIINPSAEALKKAGEAGFKVITPDAKAGGVIRLQSPPGHSLEDAQQRLREIAPQTQAAPNLIYRIEPQGKDPVRAIVSAQNGPCPKERCYGSDLLNWTPQFATCANGVKVGVIDTFVDVGHPAFKERSIALVPRNARQNKRAVETAHGTGVLSVLAGSATSGTPGLIPGATFTTTDIFFADSDGNAMSDTKSLVDGLKLLADEGVEVINLSLAGPRDEVIEDQIREMIEKRNIVFVAAAGNRGPGAEPSYPAAYPGVIAVTAIDKNLDIYRYATQGKFISVAAPGVDIWTAVPGAKEGYQSGTSFAVPYVTAIVAGVLRQMPKKRTKEMIIAAMAPIDLGAPGPDAKFGRGLAQAPKTCTPPVLPSAPSPGPWTPDVVAERRHPLELPPMPEATLQPARSTGPPPVPQALGFGPAAKR